MKTKQQIIQYLRKAYENGEKVNAYKKDDNGELAYDLNCIGIDPKTNKMIFMIADGLRGATAQVDEDFISDDLSVEGMD